MSRSTITALLAAFMMANASVAYADPPGWAPAHGYRFKHEDDDHWRREDRRHHYQHRDRYADDDYKRGPAYSQFGSSQSYCDRSLLGGAIGAGTGAAIGTRLGKGDGRTVAIIGGAVLGAIVGGNIGRSMDRADQYCAGQALENMPDGHSVVWNRADGRGYYQVAPLRTTRRDNGGYCREYVTTAEIGGNPQQVYGTACRRPDGSWEIVNSDDSVVGRRSNAWRPL